MSLTAALLAATVGAAPAPPDLAAVDHTLRREPAYRTNAPKYGLLVFGPRAEHRVWLVWDGDTLYVDRNGDGDLTQPGEAVAARQREPGQEEGAFAFDVGEIPVGGLTHRELTVFVNDLAGYGRLFDNHPAAKAALARDPKAKLFSLSVEVQMPGLKGGAPGGRVRYTTGVTDLDGPLLFADRPGDAPVIHFGGPLRVTLYGERPTLRLERDQDLVLCVGTPGAGPGTFAMIDYADTIPEKAFPRVEITFPAKSAMGPPVRDLYELKERC